MGDRPPILYEENDFVKEKIPTSEALTSKTQTLDLTDQAEAFIH